MGFRFPVKAYTKAVLDNMSNPQVANQPVAYPWVLYDTQAAANASAAPLAFFGAVTVDKTLCNMEGPGQLPDPQHFQAFYWGCDFLQTTMVGAAATGPLADLQNILHTNRATWQFDLSNSRIGPFPLTFFHSSGGPNGFISSALAAPATKEFAYNGIFDGGYCVNGGIVIPPKLGFDVIINFAAALTLTQTPLNVRAWQAGVLYRKVV